MILATEPPVGENLAKLESRCKMFHVEHPDSIKINVFLWGDISVDHSLGVIWYFPSSFVPRGTIAHCIYPPKCSTWNILRISPPPLETVIRLPGHGIVPAPWPTQIVPRVTL